MGRKRGATTHNLQYIGLKLAAHYAWKRGDTGGQKTPPKFRVYVYGMEKLYATYGMVPDIDVYLPKLQLTSEENAKEADAFNSRLVYKGQRAKTSREDVRSRPKREPHMLVHLVPGEPLNPKRQAAKDAFDKWKKEMEE